MFKSFSSSINFHFSCNAIRQFFPLYSFLNLDLYFDKHQGRFRFILCLASFGPNDDALFFFSCRKKRVRTVFFFYYYFPLICWFFYAFFHFFVPYRAKVISWKFSLIKTSLSPKIYKFVGFKNKCQTYHAPVYKTNKF